MAVGDIGIWIDQNGYAITTTMAKFPFEGTGSESRNDGGYTYNSGTDDVTLADTGTYLAIYTITTNSTAATRGGVGAYMSINGTKVEGTQSSGYRRNATTDTVSARGYGIVNITAGDELAVYARITATGGSGVVGESSLMLVRMQDDSEVAYSHYEFTSAQGLGGTTWGDVAIASTLRETDAATIERTGNNIRLKKADTVYLISYAINSETAGTRTTRISRAVSGSTHIPGSNSYAYCRDASNFFSCPAAMFLYKTTSANEDISIQCRRDSAPGWNTSVDGSFSTTVDAGVFVAELSSGVEAFISSDNTGAQTLSGGISPVIDSMRNEQVEDSASFISSTTNSVVAQKAMDALILASVSATKTATSSSKLYSYGGIRINSTLSGISKHYNILRGDASSTDCPDCNWNMALIGALSSSDSIDLQMVDAGDNGLNDSTNAGQVGFSAINLDTLTVIASTGEDTLLSGLSDTGRSIGAARAARLGGELH